MIVLCLEGAFHRTSKSMRQDLSGSGKQALFHFLDPLWGHTTQAAWTH